jgi:hypothetical protein
MVYSSIHLTNVVKLIFLRYLTINDLARHECIFKACNFHKRTCKYHVLKKNM